MSASSQLPLCPGGDGLGNKFCLFETVTFKKFDFFFLSFHSYQYGMAGRIDCLLSCIFNLFFRLFFFSLALIFLVFYCFGP